MENLNFICGMPRAGSTLLVNLLNQNPDFHASHTSPLPMLINNIVVGTNTIEYKNDLTLDKTLNDRVIKGSQEFCKAYYSNVDKKKVFDKNRFWGNQIYVCKQLNQNGKIIVCVRDLREIFASCIKQDRKHPMFVGVSNITDLYIKLFDTKGLIGNAVKTTVDIYQNDLKDVCFLPYAPLAQNPEKIMRELYGFLGDDYFNHDFINVKNTCKEADTFYDLKYPHHGSGAIKYQSEWRGIVPDEIAKDILTRFKIYNKIFGFEETLIRK